MPAVILIIDLLLIYYLYLLSAIELPKQLAICKCAAHTNKSDFISLGNARADEAAKAAHIDPSVLRDMQEASPDKKGNH